MSRTNKHGTHLRPHCKSHAEVGVGGLIRIFTLEIGVSFLEYGEGFCVALQRRLPFVLALGHSTITTIKLAELRREEEGHLCEREDAGCVSPCEL
jgi:hypothetical protein